MNARALATGVAALVLALGAACGGQGRQRPAAAACRAPASGAALILRDQVDLGALAGCRVFDGSLVIEGAGEFALAELAALERVTGSLRLGPTLGMSSLDGFASLREIGGDLIVTQDFAATGAYFSALVRIEGRLSVFANASLANLVLGQLTEVGGVWIADNPALERVDLGRLARVNGDLAILDNPLMSSMELSAPTVRGVRLLQSLRAASVSTRLSSPD